jgi:hypothetical protein
MEEAVKALLLAFVFSIVGLSSSKADVCQSFSASTLNANGVAPAKWRIDYPARHPNPRDQQPWESIDFRTSPVEYMNSILADARTSFRMVERKLVGTGQENWWISQWLDYGNSGREPLMGLTKERGPDKGDLSPSSLDGHQVWAVGFYNRPGAAVLGDIFAEPCNPSLPVVVQFPPDTASIKFLFTDASTSEVAYLQGGPEFDAFIDPAGSGSASRPARRCGCCKWTSPLKTRVHETQDGYSERLCGKGHPGETTFSTTLSRFPFNGEMIRKCMTLRCAKPGSIQIFETSRTAGPRGPRWAFKGARTVPPITSARLACQQRLQYERFGRSCSCEGSCRYLVPEHQRRRVISAARTGGIDSRFFAATGSGHLSDVHRVQDWRPRRRYALDMPLDWLLQSTPLQCADGRWTFEAGLGGDASSQAVRAKRDSILRRLGIVWRAPQRSARAFACAAAWL